MWPVLIDLVIPTIAILLPTGIAILLAGANALPLETTGIKPRRTLRRNAAITRQRA